MAAYAGSQDGTKFAITRARSNDSDVVSYLVVLSKQFPYRSRFSGHDEVSNRSILDFRPRSFTASMANRNLTPFFRELQSSHRDCGHRQITDLTNRHACLALQLRELIGEVQFMLQCNEAWIGTKWIEFGFYF